MDFNFKNFKQKQPKTTLEEIIKMLNETVENLDDLCPDIDGDDWSPEFSFVNDLYFDPFFNLAMLAMPPEPWQEPQGEQLSWDIRDFEPYEAGRLASPNREKG